MIHVAPLFRSRFRLPARRRASDQDRLVRLAWQNCPVSKVLKATITLDAKLAPDRKLAFNGKGWDA
jgi:hypothetical protein